MIHLANIVPKKIVTGASGKCNIWHRFFVRYIGAIIGKAYQPNYIGVNRHYGKHNNHLSLTDLVFGFFFRSVQFCSVLFIYYVKLGVLIVHSNANMSTTILMKSWMLNIFWQYVQRIINNFKYIIVIKTKLSVLARALYYLDPGNIVYASRYLKWNNQTINNDNLQYFKAFNTLISNGGRMHSYKMFINDHMDRLWKLVN